MSVDASMSIALSGLSAAQSRFNAAASEIARMGADAATDTASSSSAPLAGVAAAGVTYAAPIAASPAHDLAATGFDLTGSMVDILTAKISYTASASVMKAADDMAKTTINMVG